MGDIGKFSGPNAEMAIRISQLEVLNESRVAEIAALKAELAEAQEERDFAKEQEALWMEAVHKAWVVIAEAKERWHRLDHAMMTPSRGHGLEEWDALGAILASTPGVPAVVDARVSVDGRTTQYHCIKVPVDLPFDTPVRVTVARRKEARDGEA